MAGSVANSSSANGRGDARERLLSAAYELFSRQGVQAVGIDAIIERSGVARQTMYRHFGSKQDLVLAFLERREELWTQTGSQTEVRRRAAEPADQPAGDLRRVRRVVPDSGFEGCSFINVMLEHPDAAHPVHRAAAAYLAGIRHFLEDLARERGSPTPDGFARQWHILMKGSIVAAGEGDQDAARRAKQIAARAAGASRLGSGASSALDTGSAAGSKVDPRR